VAIEATPKETQSLNRHPLLEAAKSSSADWAIPALLFLVTWAIYSFTRTHYNTFDAVSYANQIAHLYPETHERRWLFHPHHLLFNALGYACWRFAQALGYRGGSLVILENLNAFSGAAGVTLYYLILRQLLHRSRSLPVLIALGLGLSYGYWVCATDGRVNMISTVLLIAAFMALLKLLESATTARAAIVGLLAGIAVLFHESTGLFVLVGIAGILLAKLEETVPLEHYRRQRLKLLLVFGGTWAATVGLPYLFIGVFALGLRSPGEFHQWMSTYSELGWWWDFRFAHNLRPDAYALRHAAFAEPIGKQGTFHIAPNAPTAEVMLYFSTLGGWFAAVYAFTVAVPLLWNSHYHRVMIVSLIWIVLYTVFFTIWSPGYFVFWVPVLVPVSLLISLALGHYRARFGIIVNWLVAIWIGMYTVVNLATSIGEHMQVNSSPFQVIAQDVKSHTQHGDLVIAAGAGDAAQCEVDIPYFANRTCVSLHTTLEREHELKANAFHTLQAQIDETIASGHRVYVLDELWHNSHTWKALQYRHPELQRSDLDQLFSPYLRTIAWRSPRQTVWEIKKKP
jgi:hypothetical protein